MAFHDIRFPAALSFGSVGGPERRTEIVTLANGYEERNSPWAHSRRRYDAGLGLRSLDDLEALVAFFEARGGQLHAFRWKDWSEHKSCPPSGEIGMQDQVIGVGDEVRTLFQLTKTYGEGVGAYARPITKPVAGRVRLAVGGDPREEGVDYTVDYGRGEVTFVHPPDVGAYVTAGFEFDVPVRFDTDHLAVNLANFAAGEVPSIPMVEVRL